MAATTIETVARLIGDKWSMLVVRDVFRGVRRFDDLQADLGVSRAVLTDRLNVDDLGGATVKASALLQRR